MLSGILKSCILTLLGPPGAGADLEIIESNLVLTTSFEPNPYYYSKFKGSKVDISRRGIALHTHYSVLYCAKRRQN